MLYCFLDTNIFLQYQTFDEIDWPKILNTTSVCLVVPKKVIQELDKHKNDPISDRRRKRAEMALKKIVHYKDQPEATVRANVIIKVETVAPKAAWFEERGYDSADADDAIVGAIHYLKENEPNLQLVLFSGDYGIRLKAQSNGIPVAIPSDEIKLPAEPDPHQQENQRLQRELQRFQNAQPKLSIEFENDEGGYSNIIDFQINFKEVELLETAIKKQISRKFELLEYNDEVDGEFNSTNSSSFASAVLTSIDFGKKFPSREEVNNYHLSLNAFLQNEYADYLRQLQLYKNLKNLTCSINLILNNKGTAPAKNIDVWLYFPDGLQVSEEIESEPFEPPPPVKPKAIDIYDSMLASTSIDYSFLTRNLISSDYPSEPSGPSLSIRKTNSYEIEWGPLDLKHNLLSGLPELYLLFEPIDGASKGFEIEYEITADNLIDMVKGKLIIRVTRI